MTLDHEIQEALFNALGEKITALQKKNAAYQEIEKMLTPFDNLIKEHLSSEEYNEYMGLQNQRLGIDYDFAYRIGMRDMLCILDHCGALPEEAE